MPVTLAFDVYGTLVDPSGIAQRLSNHCGEKALAVAQKWREKQLEYTFRRGLMRDYRTLSVCTREALDYVNDYFELGLTDPDKSALMSAYRILPAYEDAKYCLQSLDSDLFKVYAFSNGTADAVQELLDNAAIASHFIDIISADEIGTFKPDLAVYHHFLKRAACKAEETWLISGNPFDLIGARHIGMHAAWVRRSGSTHYDPWGRKPTVSVTDLNGLSAAIARYLD